MGWTAGVPGREKALSRGCMAEAIERLLRHVEYEPTTGCWLWSRSTTVGGYGQISAENVPLQTHRLTHAYFIGPIPDGHLVLHKCDTPACCNPDHTFTGTHKINTHDAMAKGRMRGGICPRDLQWKVKLTLGQVAELRAEGLAGAPYVALSRAYGISRQHARRLVLGIVVRKKRVPV